MTFYNIVSAIAFTLIGILISIRFQKEKNIWNNGYCLRCDSKWEYFHTNSNKERIYKCPKCDLKCNISYKIIDKKREK